MTRFFLVCLGGAVGTGARYLLGGLIASAGGLLPWGTFTVNALGSFLIALILQVALGTDLVPPTLRLVLTTGVMGGFTTYSTFNYEALQFFEKGAWLMGGLYLGAMLAGCLAAGIAGGWLGAQLVR